MKDFTPVEQVLDHTFTNKLLLKQAFVHRSYLNEHPDCDVGQNERLEFLGDAVLELVVTEYLYHNYPDQPEGIMTNWRAALVNTNMISQVADEHNFGDFLYLSRGEAGDTGKARQYILANTFESVVGALYLDAGWEKAKQFITTHLLEAHLQRILDEKLWIDPKSNFQEAAQERMSITPSYKVLSEKGPDHAREFTVGVYLDKELVAKGIGTSKQEAQVAAAKKALTEKGWL